MTLSKMLHLTHWQHIRWRALALCLLVARVGARHLASARAVRGLVLALAWALLPTLALVRVILQLGPRQPALYPVVLPLTLLEYNLVLLTLVERVQDTCAQLYLEDVLVLVSPVGLHERPGGGGWPGLVPLHVGGPGDLTSPLALCDMEIISALLTSNSSPISLLFLSLSLL